MADHETGDLAQWDRISISGSANAEIVSDVVHTGSYAGALSVSSDDGGVRMVVVTTDWSPADKTHPQNLPDEAFYSVWYYFPQKIDHHSNVFQWKQAEIDRPGHQTRRLLYFVRADWDSNTSQFQFHLRGKVNPDGSWASSTHSVDMSSAGVPLNTWVHLECRYRWSKTGNGRITCWQDGTEIIDATGLYTELDVPYIGNPRQWTVNNYSRDTTPDSHTIYIDDAAIATSRLGG